MNSKKSKKVLKLTPDNIFDYIFVCFVSVLLILLIFWLFGIDLKIPLNFSGDAIVQYNFAKNIIDSGWWANNSQYGAPGGQELFDFPLSDGLHLLIIKILISLGFNWFQSINIFYILTFPLTSIIAYYVLNKLGVKRNIGISISIIYAFMPFHLYRGIDHLFIASYYTVPLGVLISYYFAKGVIPKKMELIILAAILASSGAYYTYFSIFLVTVGFLISFVKKFDKKVLVNYLFFVCLVGVIFIANLLPSIMYSTQYGRNYNTTTRFPSEAETYGLKIIQLLLPIEDHNLPIFNKITKKYITYAPPGSFNESRYSSLGIIALLGFMYLLYVAIIENKRGDNLKLFSIFTLSLILLATVGGFSTILSLYINPIFRSVNRVSIFIAFISLAAFALLVQKIEIKKRYLTFLIWGIIPLAIFDQVSIGSMGNFRNTPENYQDLVTFVDSIENSLEKDDRVYTLPFGGYPEGSEKSLMKLALISNDIKWSTGASKWRSTNYWQYEVSKKDPKDFLKSIIARGFLGLVIDVEKESEIYKKQLKEILGEYHLSLDDKYIFYNLNEYKKEKHIERSIPEIEYYVSGNCVHNYSKKSRVITKYWCVDKAPLIVNNNAERNLQKTIAIDVKFAAHEQEEMIIETILKPGVNKIVLTKKDDGVYKKPFGEIMWPSTLDYPNFIIYKVNVT